jgi:hypothetical protein
VSVRRLPKPVLVTYVSVVDHELFPENLFCMYRVLDRSRRVARRGWVYLTSHL